MDRKEIKIEKGQYLHDIYPLIESNIILNKKLSGVGATHCEIIAPRNSIIVVPNIPIITCKVERHCKTDNLFGVMQGIKIRDVVEYIENSIEGGKFIKIMVTPESFHKVRQAFGELDVNMYETCFLLLDECHKFIKERDFRQDITLPFRSFFKFRNKALVSATPIVPSDPRFKEQNFTLVEIVPQFFHLFQITVIETNNIKKAFYDDMHWFNEYGCGEFLCVFVNSAELIGELITNTEINDISSVFCSEKSAIKLKGLGIKNVHSEWKEEFKKPFMFFTSRFYTGVDIWLDEKPRVIYLTDAKDMLQTLMDPKTDMAQACGRFRNGMTEIMHYVVFNPQIETVPKSEIEEYISGIEKAYTSLRELHEITKSPVQKKAILNSLQSLPYNDIFVEGKMDYFLKDNKTNFEELKSKYKDFNSLRDEYGESKYFIVPMQEQPHIYFTDRVLRNDSKKVEVRKFKLRQNKAIIETLERIVDYRGTTEVNEIINYMRGLNGTMVDAFFKLGPEFIKASNYSTKKIKEKLQLRKDESEGYDNDFLDSLYATFENGKKYLRSDVKEKLKHLYEKFDIVPPKTITALSIGWHFEIDEKARIGNSKAIKIISPKVQGALDYHKSKSELQ